MTTNERAGLALVGAGALGQAFAGLLAASGLPITLFATPRSAARLLDAGVIRLYGVAQLEIPVTSAPAPAGQVAVTTDPAALPAGTGLIFATKAHQLPAAIAGVRAAWPPPGDDTSWVGGLQNGLVKDDFLADAFGQERTLGMVTIFSGQSDAEGRINVTSRGMTYLGELGGGGSERVETAAALLQRADIPATASDDIQSVRWSKACHAAGIFGVSVLARASGPRMMRNPDLTRAYLALLRESATLAEAQGIALGDYSGFPVHSYLAQSEQETLQAFAAR
ncbi:MAG TPA: 2-dehydropantoate 2-reductase N-terminal domain-containing protein, partial [Roseiflexaceae bacterium]|nr:2-dehydropantoate 2-reductase N-terminal domain-containing protein [Roseiflexaceae bacterium]